jgi:hypothetical protein
MVEAGCEQYNFYQQKTKKESYNLNDVDGAL